MARSKEKRTPDERIEKESNQLAGKLFYVLCGLLIVSIAVKCYFHLPHYVYALEIISLFAGVACFVVCEMRDGILFIANRDTVLTELHRKAQAKAITVQFWIMTIGQGILLCLEGYIEPLQQYFWWYTSYLIILFPISIIITITTVKMGWLVWGSKKQEKIGRKKNVIHAAIAGLVYGVLMEVADGFENLYHDGAFHIEGVLWIVGSGVLFAVFIYFAMCGFIKVSEKNADKRLKEAGAEVEEQGGEACEE